VENEAVSPWIVVGAAVQGWAHEKLELPCQDALAYRALPGGILLAALADGAGSAERADLGASTAVAAALDTLAAGLELAAPEETGDWETLLRGAFAAARQALDWLAEEQAEPLREFATTLICAAAGSRLIVAQLGDGAVVGRTSQGELFAATRPQRGEYANETLFLTGEGALEQVEVQVIETGVDALAVMSDGLTRLALKLPAGDPHSPFFEPLFSFLERESTAGDGAVAETALANFLASERVNARTDDDKSLLLAVRKPPDSP
jgi:hypothetical protein